MRRLSSYPRWFFSLLMLVMVVLVGSGLLLVPTMLDMRLGVDSPVQVSADLRLAGAAVHTLIAFLMMMVLGALSIVHMRMGWRRHLNRISGIGLLLLFCLLLVTSIGMFYFGDEDYSRWSSLLHSVGGTVLVALFVWHLEKGRRIRLELSKH